MLILILSLFSQTTKHTDVDLIEINRVKNDKVEFVQVIVYRWSPDYCRLDICGWWMLGEKRLKIYTGKINKVVFINAEEVYEIRSPIIMYTETWLDPELEQRKLVPCSERPQLFKIGRQR